MGGTTSPTLDHDLSNDLKSPHFSSSVTAVAEQNQGSEITKPANIDEIICEV
jgi:hypothetical protein